MNVKTRWLGGLFVMAGMTGSTWALEMTAVTLFGTNEQGVVDAAFRVNSGPVDAAWDLFLFEGDPFDPEAGDPREIRWLNDPQRHTVSVPLTPGVHTFTFHTDFSQAWPIVGMNLFFDGIHDRAGISVLARTDTQGPPHPEFRANRAGKTMGWPITDVPASGSLDYTESSGGLWEFPDASPRMRVRLKQFRFSHPSVDGDLDLVGPHEIGPNGKPDFVGRFVLEVEEFVSRPSDLFLWLQTRAGVTAGGPDLRAKWQAAFGDVPPAPPFSFQYGGKPGREVLARCRLESRRKVLAENRVAHTLTYHDPDTGLEVRWEGVAYRDFKTIEWTLHFKNTGSSDTPILSNVQALDVKLERRQGDEFLLHHSAGGFAGPDAYQPRRTTLGPGAEKRLGGARGRPTNVDMSYVNLEAGSEGVIVVVGWPGQWAATFRRDEGRTVHVVAGQELTHFTLHPGEQVRTPLIVLQFRDEGDWIDGQNRWRRWMKGYGVPKPGGKLPPPQLLAASSRAYTEMHEANEQNQIMFINRYLEEGLKLDYWWMDAGWYPCGDPPQWSKVGTWEVDKKRFPRGLEPISDHAHAHDMKIVVWFEPERVHGGTWLAQHHPEWILAAGRDPSSGGLLNLGDPEAHAWLTDHIDHLITENGIDLYRQDFNIDPLEYWRTHDAENRQGITEIRYVTGFLAFWDELRRRHPDMLIDTCASGGRRLDLETVRRSVPLWRSDYAFEPIGHQGQTYGLSLWLPFHGTGTVACVDAGYYGGGATPVQPYAFWSNAGISLTFGMDMRVKELDYDALRRLFGQWRAICDHYYGDFYPLTPYRLDKDAWIAWQFHRPELGAGMVQAFRRPESGFFGAQLKLRGLEPDARYELKHVDADKSTRMTGRELLEQGLEIAIRDRPGAAVVTYRIAE